MFERQRAEGLVDQITEITEMMSAITEKQRRGILENHEDQLARMDAVLDGVAANQTQLIALVRVLAGTIIEYLLDEERQHDLGLDD